MRFISVTRRGIDGIGLLEGDSLTPSRARILWSNQASFPGTLDDNVAGGSKRLQAAADALLGVPPASLADVGFLPPLRRPGKLICIGLNYVDHSKESGFEAPVYPVVFSRYASSLVGHGAPIVRPRVSEQLDYEGELAVVIASRASHVGVDQALDHVLGFSVFNDASIRDYQTKSAQWTLGKNFDHTGAFGPALVTADELPAGAKGLRLQTLLNGKVVQEANIDDMIFDVATLVSLMSEVHVLEPGDVIVTGTPSGVGLARRPQLWMKPGDVCEVLVEKVGLLRSPIVADQA